MSRNSGHRRMDDDDSIFSEDEDQNCSTLVVVIVSLLFVAIFGGALVGGVVSADASNGFYATIITASCAALVIGLIVSVRYCLDSSGEKEAKYIEENKRTFSSDDEEQGVKEKKEVELDGKRQASSKPYTRKIKEVHAVRDYPGDVSALSPNTYDVESLMTDGEQTGITSFAGRIIQNRSRQRKAGFDFSNILSSQPTRGREDPPDAFEISSQSSQAKHTGPRDPSASLATMNGKVKSILEEDDTYTHLNTPSSAAATKKISAKSPKVLMTPASEAGSFASSIFRGFFGSKKNPPTPRGEPGRPPKPGSIRPKNENRGLQTINGNLGNINVSSTPRNNAPSSPGKSSVFSIPPPRRVPSSPGGASEVEYKSTAGTSDISDGVASSTFDPAAHQRALLKMQENTASLGAKQNDMPMYYDEDGNEDGNEDGSVQVGVYDVYAPSGPLGIVVDTTEKGCIVHSLRKTSSMKGLITPGDLIIALDDVNVQKMDASSLTKLMAKKSQQAERKFTLAADES